MKPLIWFLAAVLIWHSSQLAGWPGVLALDPGRYQKMAPVVDDGNNLTQADLNLLPGAWLSEITDVYMPATLVDLRSGWDVREVHLDYDLATDTAYFGIVFYGIASDADGDGNASETSILLELLGGSDLPALGGSESITLLIDTNNTCAGDACIVDDFFPTLAVSKASAENSTLADYAVYELVNILGDVTTLEIQLGTRISPVEQPLDPMETIVAIEPLVPELDNLTAIFSTQYRSDFELAVPNFSKLPGMHRQPGGELRFSFALYAGSNDDSTIGYDIVPNLRLIEALPESYLAIVGASAEFPCEGVASNGHCCLPQDVDYCGDCHGGNSRMDVCGVCDGLTTDPTHCPGSVLSSTGFNLTELGIPAHLSTILSSIGDIDGNGVDDLLIGVPGLPVTWRTDSSPNITSPGQVFVVLLHANKTVASFTHLVAGFNPTNDTEHPSVSPCSVELTAMERAPGAIPSTTYSIGCLDKDSLFGLALSATNDLVVDSRPDVVVGAPGAFGSGVLCLLYLNGTGHLLNVALIPFNQTGLSEEVDYLVRNTSESTSLALGFGSSVGTMTLDGARVIVSSYNSWYPADGMVLATLNATGTSFVAFRNGGVVLIVLGVDGRVLGAKLLYFPLDSKLVQEWVAANASVLFVSASPIGDLDGNNILEIAITVTVNTHPVVITAFLAPTGTVSKLSLLLPPLSFGRALSRSPYSIVSMGDLNGDFVPDVLIGDHLSNHVYVCFLNYSGGLASDPVAFGSGGVGRFLHTLHNTSQLGASVVAYRSNEALVSTDPSLDTEERFFAMSLSSKVASPGVPQPPSFQGPTDFPAGGFVIVLPDDNRTITLPPDSSSPPPPITVTFIDRSPNHIIQPQNSASKQSVRVLFDSLAELGNNETSLSQFKFPTSGMSYSSQFSSTSGEFSCVASVRGSLVPVAISTLLFDTEKVVVFNDAVLFRVMPNTNKFTIKVSHWPFSDPLSTLRLQVLLNISAPILKREFEYSSVERVTRYIFSGAHHEVLVGIPHFALIDGAVVPITPSASVQTTDSFGVVKLLFDFPEFKQTLEYDPDVTIVESVLDPSSITTTPPAFLWPIAIAAGALLLVVIVIVIAVLVRRRIKNQEHEARWRQAAQLDELRPKN